MDESHTIGTNGVNNFTGCGGRCHHGSLLPPPVRTVLLLVEDEEKWKIQLRPISPKCPNLALLYIYSMYVCVHTYMYMYNIIIIIYIISFKDILVCTCTVQCCFTNSILENRNRKSCIVHEQNMWYIYICMCVLHVVYVCGSYTS